MRKQAIKFHYRGERMTRIDGFSDVVFGFALTLLVVSLEVPHTYNELIHSLQGFLPFSICFALLIEIWYCHYVFFRRYGLEDTRIIVLNSALLFVVLLFVYPLKFLFTLITGHGNPEVLTAQQGRILLTIYGVGFAAVWIIFALMYQDAFARRTLLKLNEVEKIDTRQSIYMCSAQAGVGLLAVLLADTVPDRFVGITGFVYMLIGLTHTWGGSHYAKLRRMTEEKMLAARSSVTSV